MAETQKSVSEWCEAHYPGESVADMLRDLIEEVIELAAVRADLTLEEIQEIVRATWEKSQKDFGDLSQVPGEIGDVQISVLNLSAKLGFSAAVALDDKMAKNREKTVEESQARAAKKHANAPSAFGKR